MQTWIAKYLSIDDLWSVIGYALVMVLGRVSNPSMSLPSLSLLGAGMLAIVWFAGGKLRERNVDRHPNIRVAVWVLVAVASAFTVTR